MLCEPLRAIESDAALDVTTFFRAHEGVYMSAHEFRSDFSKSIPYSPDYLEGIISSYLENQKSLQAMAQAVPVADVRESADKTREEDRLLENQSHLLELATLMQPSSLKDIHQLLELWHEVAIKEVVPEDVTDADKLVLVTYHFVKSVAENSKKAISVF